jgi:hypothetical protein
VNSAFTIGLAVGVTAISSLAAAQQQALKCEAGPVVRSYGATDWNVYGCADNRSLVFVTAEESPATPFYFLLSAKDGSYRLTGEGTGNKALTDAAAKELSALGAQEISTLVSETHKSKSATASSGARQEQH